MKKTNNKFNNIFALCAMAEFISSDITELYIAELYEESGVVYIKAFDEAKRYDAAVCADSGEVLGLQSKGYLGKKAKAKSKMLRVSALNLEAGDLVYIEAVDSFASYRAFIDGSTGDIIELQTEQAA